MRKHGGRTKKAMGGPIQPDLGGAGGGAARKEKAKDYGKNVTGEGSSPDGYDAENKSNTFNKDSEFGNKKRGGAC
jgi:hypothetical protein